MEVREFEEFIAEARAKFREDLMYDPSRKLSRGLKKMFNGCCSEFEEQTFIEHLREVFESHMNELKGA